MTAARLVRTAFVPNDDQKRQFWRMFEALFRPITEHHDLAFRRKIARMVQATEGQVVSWDASVERAGWRHRKFMAMIGVGFDAWDPDATRTKRVFKGVPIEKDFEEFRKDITIQAGFYVAHYNVDGSVRLEAKSIAFDAMEEDEFERLYDAACRVLVEHFLRNYTREDLDAVVGELLHFNS